MEKVTNFPIQEEFNSPPNQVTINIWGYEIAVQGKIRRRKYRINNQKDWLSYEQLGEIHSELSGKDFDSIIENKTKRITAPIFELEINYFHAIANMKGCYFFYVDQGKWPKGERRPGANYKKALYKLQGTLDRPVCA